MADTTTIGWTDHTFNPWWGCVKISPACDHCYAERDSHRYGFSEHGGNGPELWGRGSERRKLSDKNWAKPLAWDRAAAAAGRPALVFCASMADVFEARDDLDPERARLWDLIEATPNLRWQLLTKRPEQILQRVPPRWLGYDVDDAGTVQVHGLRRVHVSRLTTAERVSAIRVGSWPPNVWIGTTVEDQARADLRIPRLLQVPAPVRFLSIEPMLGPILLSKWIDRYPRLGSMDRRRVTWSSGIGWIIVGGESGPGFRPFDVEDARSILRFADLAKIPVFFKQMSGLMPRTVEAPPDLARRREFPRSAGDRSDVTAVEVSGGG